MLARKWLMAMVLPVLATLGILGSCGKLPHPAMTAEDVAKNFTTAVFEGKTREAYTYFFVPEGATPERKKMEHEAFYKNIDALHAALQQGERVVLDMKVTDLKEDLRDEKATLTLTILYTDKTFTVTHYMLRIGSDGEWKIAKAH